MRNNDLNWIDLLLLSGCFLAFSDESVRKLIPGTPVMVTAPKDVIFLAVGVMAYLTHRDSLEGYRKYLLPWFVVSFLSSIYVFASTSSLLLLLAVIRSYCITPFLFAMGYYAGMRPHTLKLTWRMTFVAGLAAVAIGMLQEFSRDSLPAVFSERIYMERHSMAAGAYIESIFASPQTFAQLSLGIMSWCFVSLFAQNQRRPLCFLKIVLVAIFLYAIFITRIRVALLVAGMVLLLELALVQMSNNCKLTKLNGAIFVFAALSGIVLLLANDLFDDAGGMDAGNQSSDLSFFQAMLDPKELMDRSVYFTAEIENLGDSHNVLFGAGAGLGSMSSISDAGELSDTKATDTGIFLLYYEFGLVGIATFVLAYGGPLLASLGKMRSRVAIPTKAIPTFAISLLFLVWFATKNFTVMRNGFSHAFWLGSLGLCCSVLDRPEE